MKNSEIAVLQTVARTNHAHLVACGFGHAAFDVPQARQPVLCLELRLLGFKTTRKGTLVVAEKIDSKNERN